MKKQTITINELFEIVNKYLWKNKKFLEKDIDFVIGVSRGGLIPAVWIATHLNKPLITAYIDKEDNVYLDRTKWIKNKNVLIIDDVIRSGKTCRKIEKIVLDCNVKKIYNFFVFEDVNNNMILPWDIYD